MEPEASNIGTKLLAIKQEHKIPSFEMLEIGNHPILDNLKSVNAPKT